MAEVQPDLSIGAKPVESQPAAPAPEPVVHTPAVETSAIPVWFERQSKMDQAFTALEWQQMAIVEKAMQDLDPQSPNRNALEEVYDVLKYLGTDKGKASYVPENGQFTNEEGKKDNFGRYYRTISQAAQLLEEDDPQLKRINDVLRPRLMDKKVKVENAQGEEEMVEITTVDTTEVKGDVEILDYQAKALFEKACKTLGEKNLVKVNPVLVEYFFAEYVSLTKLDSGLPINVRFQMITDLIKRAKSSEPAIADALSGLSISYKVKDAKGQEKLEHASINSLASEARIRSNEIAQQKPDEDNPIVARMKKGLADKGFSEEDIDSFVAEATEAKKNGLDSWDYIGDLLRMGFEYNRGSKSVVADLASKLGMSKVTPQVQAFAELTKKNPEQFRAFVESLNQELVGSIEGVSNDMLRWAEQNLKLKQIIKKLGREGVKFSWEDWSIYMMFAYSFVGPLMVEGENTSREEE